MSTRTAQAQRARAVIAAFADRPAVTTDYPADRNNHPSAGTDPAAGETAAWRLDRGAVARRLTELVDEPRRLRQGRTNLCGPAAMMALWLRDDPEAAAMYAAHLFDRGEARIGSLPVRASRRLRELRYDGDCPPADWMMMAALRDSTNRVLRYAWPGGRREAAAAITLPGAVTRWLTAAGYDVRDETNLVVRKGLAHAQVAGTGERVALVAQEMFRRPDRRWRRARDRAVSLVPNHWIILRSPVEVTGATVRFRFWSWGAEHVATIERSTFTRCYFGCVVIDKTPLRIAGSNA
jgi:hypothetical protein